MDSTYNETLFSLNLVLFYVISLYSRHFHEEKDDYPDRKYNRGKVHCLFYIQSISNNIVGSQYINHRRILGQTPRPHCQGRRNSAELHC